MKKGKKNVSLLDKIRLDLKKIIMFGIVLNILFLIFGVVVYLNPDVTINAVGVISGIYFIIFGLFYIYEYLVRDNSLFRFKIILGILSVFLGIFIITDPIRFSNLLTTVLGIYLTILAISKLIESIQLKKYKYDGWAILLVTSIILLIFGIFIVINPMASMDLVEVAAIFVILSSILEIANLLMIYTKAKDIMKLLKGEK